MNASSLTSRFGVARAFPGIVAVLMMWPVGREVKAQAPAPVSSTPHPLQATQRALPKEGLEVPLPGLVHRMLLADGGWRVVLHFAAIGKVGVFNLATASFDGFFEAPEPGTLVATGGSTVAIYGPVSQKIEFRDVRTLRVQKTAPLRTRGRLLAMGMGLNQARYIFGLYQPDGGRMSEEMMPSIISLPEVSVSYPEVVDRKGAVVDSSPYRGKNHVYINMDPAGQVGAVHVDSYSQSRLNLFKLLPDGKIRYTNDAYQAPHPEPLNEGDMVVTPHALLSYEKEDQWKWRRPEGSSEQLMLVHGYPAVLMCAASGASSGFQLLTLPQLAPLIKLPQSSEVMRSLPNSNPGSSDRAAFLASGYSDRLLCVGLGGGSMRLWSLGLGSSSAEGQAVAAGKLLKRKLAVPDGSTVKLESGPAGMKLDTDGVTLLWEVPADVKRAQAIKVILLVKKPDGAQDYLIEEVVVP